MTEQRQMPLPLSHCWPVGLRLRFKLDAAMKRRYRYLRGTPVLVLSHLQYKEEANDWRQNVAAFGARYPDEHLGWALPEQLEIIPGDWDDPALQIGDESELRQRTLEESRPRNACRML